MNIITKTAITLVASIMIQAPYALAKLPKNITAHFPSSTISTTGISIKAPDIAENGSIVSISIDSVEHKNNTHITELWLYDQKRKAPLAHYKLSENTSAEGLKSRYKLRETSVIYAVARLSDGSMMSGHKTIKITIGGCGGGGGELSANSTTR